MSLLCQKHFITNHFGNPKHSIANCVAIEVFAIATRLAMIVKGFGDQKFFVTKFATIENFPWPQAL
jgi:hypothetical protein